MIVTSFRYIEFIARTSETSRVVERGRGDLFNGSGAQFNSPSESGVVVIGYGITDLRKRFLD